MKKINFKKISKKLWYRIKLIGSDADQDWNMFFVIFLVATLLSVIIHASIFFATNDGNASDTATKTSQGKLIDEKALQDILSKYDGRASAYASISSNPLSVVDPAK